MKFTDNAQMFIFMGNCNLVMEIHMKIWLHLMETVPGLQKFILHGENSVLSWAYTLPALLLVLSLSDAGTLGLPECQGSSSRHNIQ